MASPYIFCYADAILHGLGFLEARGIDVKDAAKHNASIRRACQNAYRELAGRRTWRYFIKLGQVNLNAAYSTGTIAYDHTGGTYERQLTLTGGTWPSWAVYGSVRIAGVNYLVEDRKSATVLTLDAQTNPGADVASSTAYEIFRSCYTLPSDFVKMNMPQSESRLGGMCYVSSEWFHSQERNSYSKGQPTHYTIARDPSLIGQMAMHVLPVPNAAESIQFVYYSRGREMKFSGYDLGYCKGEISVTADSATVTGFNTAFSEDMIGAILRIGSDGNTIPTGVDGQHPRTDERSILSVESAASLTLDAGVASTQTKVKFAISDVVDIDPGMVPCYLRCIEKHLSTFYPIRTERGIDYRGMDQITRAYEEAYTLAAEEDCRVLEIRSPSMAYQAVDDTGEVTTE
jgi:hypothetical protein